MAGQSELRIDEQGSGRPILVLHGGGGPATVSGLAGRLAESFHVLTPTHPGWNGTARPEGIAGVADLAAMYLLELDDRGLRDVAVIGSSMGGWIAAEMALRDRNGAVGRVVIVDGVGADIPGEPIVDFFALDPRGIAEHSYHEPDKFFVDPATFSAERVETMRGNMAALRAVAGERMFDPTLLGRLPDMRFPTLVLWGESDRIATPEYGRRLAAAMPRARFEIIARAGHLPQIEQPEATVAAIAAFLAMPS